MRDASVGKLEVSINRANGITVVRAEGEVDLDNADKLANALRSAGEGPGDLILDLIGVPFMDSSGLKVLLLASERANGQLTLALSPGSPVLRLLDVAEVRDRFDVHPTAEAAISSHSGG